MKVRGGIGLTCLASMAINEYGPSGQGQPRDGVFAEVGEKRLGSEAPVRPMNARLEVINAMTEPAAWLQRVQDHMGNGSEILLLLSQIDQAKSNALAKLCHAYHYSQDSDIADALSEEYRKLLDVHDYAAKEHGI